MAVDNLNYYSSWLPAWQQTDKYTSQPWCLKSKNLDIFSSSKSVKATAWSEPEDTDESWVVLVDQTGDLILKSDWNVYDRSSWSEVLVKSGIASNFPAYQVSYNWQTWTYSNAQRWTEKQLLSKYENGNLKYFTIFTDRSRYFYSAEEYKIPDEDEVYTLNGWESSGGVGLWKKNGTSATTTIRFKISNLKWVWMTRLMIRAMNEYNYTEEWHITISSISVDNPRYWYNDETWQMEYGHSSSSTTLTGYEQLDDSTWKVVYVDIPIFPISDDYSYYLTISLKHTYWTDNTHTWTHWRIETNILGYHDGYNYLPVDANRYLEETGEYYWENEIANQVLYNWSGEWMNSNTYQRVVRYDLVKYMSWASDVSMDVVAMIAWNEQIYMIGNMNWNWYIFPCDLSWGRWTPYIAFGCTFKWATNIDYLLYLVWEDRWVSTLWVFNQQELVPLVWGSQESQYDDLVGVDEQYRFDWKIVNYRKNLILTTEDGRIFRYWQTYGGKGGTFIHDLPEDCEIKSLRAKDNDLIVRYAQTTTSWGVDTVTNYAIIYQDDTPYKNYNTEWEAVYPIVLGNHLLEKEESDLYASYILPSFNTSLEFWGMANHYHFWTFTSADDPELDSNTHYKLKDTYWSYYLQFVERNGDQWTFRLIGDLPSLTEIGGLTPWGWGWLWSFIPWVWGEWKYKIVKENWDICLTYDSFNHFRKIWEITTDSYQEWEFRFHNLNNKLELPKTHSLQIMVKGKGNENYTPELFALDLVANQRDRW